MGRRRDGRYGCDSDKHLWGTVRYSSVTKGCSGFPPPGWPHMKLPGVTASKFRDVTLNVKFLVC